MGLYIKPRTGGSALPPAPAPTARDANPWPMPEQYGDRPNSRDAKRHRTTGSPTLTGPRVRTPTASVPATKLPRLETPPPARASVENNPLQATRKRLRFAPLLVMAGVAVGALVGARRAWLSGDYAAAIGPLLVVAIIAFSTWRGSRRL